MKRNQTKSILPGITALGASLLSSQAYAHCPLCTAGAGLAAAGAVWLGVNSTVVGISLGAFGLALGLWLGAMVKRQYIKYQRFIIGIFSFLTTILPLQPLLRDYTSIYISLTGDYGTVLNRTYLIDHFLLGNLIGAAVIVAAPRVSKLLTQARQGKILPYQGMCITFSLLVIVSLIGQLVL
jgi:hypothetical protein